MRRRAVAVVLSCALVGIGGAPTAGALQGGDAGIAQDRVIFGALPSLAVPLDGSMWVLDRRGGTIARIDPGTNEIVDEIDLEEIDAGSAWDLEAMKGSLWITTHARRFVEIDPANGEVRSVVRTNHYSSELYPARGSFWYVTGNGHRTKLVRLDPATGRKLADLRLGRNDTNVSDVVPYEGSVWVVRSHARHVAGTGRNPTFYVTAALWEVDPKSNRVVDKMPLGATYTRGPVDPVIGDVEVAENGLWMSRVHERRLMLVRPLDGRVLDVEDLGEFRLPWEFEIVAGDLWVGNLNRGEVARIDPATNETWFTDVAAQTSYLGSGFGSAWAPVVGGEAAHGEVVRLTAE